MKIGVFLDVDKTLTRDFIQHQYALALNCERDYFLLEERFQRSELSSEAFGSAIIALFASKHFTPEKARQISDQVALQPWTDELLRLPVDKYLVSSGPNYYIDRLAQQYEVPHQNVCRTVYKFSEETGLIESCNPISPPQKASFVEERSPRYDISIGIGDSASLDGPFISHCTIALLTMPSEHYLHASNFNSIILLIESLTKDRQETSEISAERSTLYQIIKAFKLQDWAAIVATAAAVFGAGAACERALPQLFH